MLTGTYRCRIRGFHPLWQAFPDPSAIDGFVTPQCFRNPGVELEPPNGTPDVHPVLRCCEFYPGLGYVRFRSPLLTE